MSLIFITFSRNDSVIQGWGESRLLYSSSVFFTAVLDPIVRPVLECFRSSKYKGYLRFSDYKRKVVPVAIDLPQGLGAEFWAVANSLRNDIDAPTKSSCSSE
jgi:hypothetical protein